MYVYVRTKTILSDNTTTQVVVLSMLKLKHCVHVPSSAAFTYCNLRIAERLNSARQIIFEVAIDPAGSRLGLGLGLGLGLELG